MVENARDAILGGGRSGGELSIGGIASYQPLHGLMELKVVIHLSLSSFVTYIFFLCNSHSAIDLEMMGIFCLLT
jgi:hypothetical protein